ncbi:hypothetical protein BDR26DRAFT_855953, partial [Obelidium mucronatum]
ACTGTLNSTIYNTVGDKYLGSGLKVQYQNSVARDRICELATPANIQYRLDTCTPNFENRTIQFSNTTNTFKYERAYLQDGLVTVDFYDGPCDTSQVVGQLGNINSNRCFQFQVSQSYDWYEEVYYKDGNCLASGTPAAVHVGKSLKCVPSTPDKCSKSNPFVRSCVSETASSEPKAAKQSLFGNASHAELWNGDCAMPDTLNSFSVAIDQCTLVSNGSIKALVVLNDWKPDSERLTFVDVQHFSTSDCSVGATLVPITRYQVEEKGHGYSPCFHGSLSTPTIVLIVVAALFGVVGISVLLRKGYSQAFKTDDMELNRTTP